MQGFSTADTAILITQGWILGTECGYRHHAGWVCTRGRWENAYLVPSKNGGFMTYFVGGNRIAFGIRYWASIESILKS